MRAQYGFVTAVLAMGLAVHAGPDYCPGTPAFTIPCDSLGPAGTPFVRGTNCRIVMVEGYPRDYVVYVPPSPSFNLAKANPLVMHFHGSGGSAEGSLGNSGWREKADAEGVVAVLGSGLHYLELPQFGGECKAHWNDAFLESFVDLDVMPPGYPDEASWPADDVAFSAAMLDDVTALLSIDARRVYGSGFSNGNAFLRRAITELPGSFAAAGGGGMAGDSLIPVPSPPRQTSYYNTVGSLDAPLIDLINRMDPQRPPIAEAPLTYAELFSYSYIQAALGAMLDTFGLSSVPDHVWEFKDELRVEYTTPVPGNTDGNVFILSVQKGVTHQFPDGINNPEGFNAPDILWKFMKQNPGPK